MAAFGREGGATDWEAEDVMSGFIFYWDHNLQKLNDKPIMKLFINVIKRL